MKNYSIKLPKLNSQEDFQQFIAAIEGQFNNTSLQLSGNIAKGSINIHHPDAGFYVSCWNVTFNNPVDLYKEALPSYFANNSYSVLYILSPNSMAVKNIGGHAQYSGMDTRNSLLIADDIGIQFTVLPGQPVQFVYINLTTFWLRQQFKDTNSAIFDFSTNEEKDTPLVHIEPVPAALSQVASRLFNLSFVNTINVSDLYEPSMALVTDCMERKFKRDNHKTTIMGNNYYEQMAEVETILQTHLQSNLPTLDIIARKVGLSVSTLKRKFKAVFGKSIYEYYLEKKMDLAKNLLTEKPLSVNEAAEIFGYEKVSNFIDIFKKFHGNSPGKFKKSLSVSQ